jgi:hypothetical protein
MSLMPLKSKENGVWYGARREAEEEETKLLVGVPGKAPYVEFEVSEVIVALFINGQHGHDLHEHPKTSPPMCPETRFKRHRNYYIWTLNQFRHWWKTSRLLVRLSGGYENCLDPLKWEAMGTYVVSKRKQGKMALRSMKAIGRGGPSSDFLKTVKPVSGRIIKLSSGASVYKLTSLFVSFIVYSLHSNNPGSSQSRGSQGRQ